jgi:hypothetical protein
LDRYKRTYKLRLRIDEIAGALKGETTHCGEAGEGIIVTVCWNIDVVMLVISCPRWMFPQEPLSLPSADDTVPHGGHDVVVNMARVLQGSKNDEINEDDKELSKPFPWPRPPRTTPFLMVTTLSVLSGAVFRMQAGGH